MRYAPISTDSCDTKASSSKNRGSMARRVRVHGILRAYLQPRKVAATNQTEASWLPAMGTIQRINGAAL